MAVIASQTLIRGAQQTSSPWKNGGGSTQELLIWPPGASLEQFRWRISVARIDQDGPFSAFAGYQRTLVLLNGVGMDLDFAERLIKVEKAKPRIDFDGNKSLYCRLLEGPTRALNLMLADDQAGASLAVTELAGEFAAQGEAAELLGVYLCNGTAETALGPMLAGDFLYGSSLALTGTGQALLMRLPR